MKQNNIEQIGGHTIYCIVGNAGSGKDFVAKQLSSLMDIPIIVSYTTRAIRDGETNGVEHFFVPQCNTEANQRMAYTVYGGYEYWTEKAQFEKDCIYIIDEKGVFSLIGNTFNRIVLIGVERDEQLISETIHDTQRLKRDEERTALPDYAFKHIIINNGTLDDLRISISDVADKLLDCQESKIKKVSIEKLTALVNSHDGGKRLEFSERMDWEGTRFTAFSRVDNDLTTHILMIPYIECSSNLIKCNFDFTVEEIRGFIADNIEVGEDEPDLNYVYIKE